MSHELNCPHCGCPLLANPDALRVPDAEPVELLNQELEHLRATVARLRGAGAGRVGPGPSRSGPVPDTSPTS